MGVDLPPNSDEQTALRHLAQSYQQSQQLVEQNRQLQQLAQYGQAVLPHWQHYQSWLREQQQKQATQQQQDQQRPWWDKYWQPPEFNPAWERLIVQDPATGEYKTIPGAAPDLLTKYTAWKQFRQEQAERLMSNPFQYFEEPVKHLAQQVAQEIVQQHLGQYQDTNFSTQWVEQNSSWLHQRDAQGNVVFSGHDQQGKPVPALTPAGQAFANYVVEAEQMGVKGVQAQQRYAQRMLERELALQKVQAQTNGQAGEQKKQQFVQQHNAGANHQPGYSGSIPSGAAPAAVQNPSRSLSQRLLDAFKAEGFQPHQELVN